MERKFYGKILRQRKYLFLETICMTFYIESFQYFRNSVLHWMYSWQWRQSSCLDIVETRRKEETYVSAVIEKIPTTTVQLHLFIYFWSAYLKSKHGFSRPRKENHICPAIFGQCNDYQWRGESYQFYFHNLSSTVLQLLQTWLRWSLSNHLYFLFYTKLHFEYQQDIQCS